MKFQELVLWLVVLYHRWRDCRRQVLERRDFERFNQDVERWIAEMPAGECSE